MTLSNQCAGWIEDRPAVAAYLAARAEAGHTAVVGDARPDLRGYWQRLVEDGIYAVLPFQAEEDLLGHYLPADLQRRGTCVARGTYRAIQTGYWDAVCDRRITGKAERIAYEPIYGGARVNIGRGQLAGDGAVGAWAAQWVHDYGVIARGVHGSIDLTNDREDLAVSWGAPGRGVPRELIAEGQAYRCDAYHVSGAKLLADVTAARYCSAICSTHRQADRRDNNGECAYAGPTAHCEAIVGVYLRPSWDGRPETIYQHTGFVDQQSWGQVPGGPDVLRYYGNGSAKLREGAYGTPLIAVEKRMPTGETWAFRLRDGFRSRSLHGALTQ